MSRDIRGGIQWNGSMILNWHLLRSLRLGTVCPYARVLAESGAYVLQARFQIDRRRRLWRPRRRMPAAA